MKKSKVLDLFMLLFVNVLAILSMPKVLFHKLLLQKILQYVSMNRIKIIEFAAVVIVFFSLECSI